MAGYGVVAGDGGNGIGTCNEREWDSWMGGWVMKNMDDMADEVICAL